MLEGSCDEVSKSVIASLLTEIRRKPQLIIHLQVSLTLLLILFSLVSHIPNLNSALSWLPPDTTLLLAFTLSSLGLIASLMLYVSAWKELVDKIKSELPKYLEDYFRKFPESFEEAIDTTIWDVLKPEDLRRLLPSIAVFPISYYGIWISFLILLDSLTLITIGFSFISILLQHFPIVILLLIVSTLTSAIVIDIWPMSTQAEGLGKAFSSNVTDYIRYFFGNIFLDPRRSKRSVHIPKWLLEAVGNILTPIPYVKTKIISVDALDLLFDADVIRRRFSEILSADNNNNKHRRYWIEPLKDKKEECKDLSKMIAVKIPLLSSACWYKAIKDGRIIGYIMMFKLVTEKPPYIATARHVKPYKEKHLVIFMFGTEEIMELKYVFLK